ncbi:MAG: tetratricopeptide repeat protein [Burkholderiaceae bacterium]
MSISLVMDSLSPQRHHVVTKAAGRSMGRLQLQLLGPGQLRVSGRRVAWRSAKALALLTYLVVESARSHARTRLAGLLWPDSPPARASHSLRQTLHWMRSVEHGALAPCLEITRDTVRFLPSADIDADVLQILGGQARSNAPGGASQPGAELLEGRVFADLPEFEHWLDVRRRQLGVAIEALHAPARPPAAAAELSDREARSVDALRTAARRAEGVQGFANALLLYERALAVVGDRDAVREQRLNLMLARESMLDRLGQRREQAMAAAQCLALAERLGDPSLLATAWLRVAGTRAHRGDINGALQACSQALTGLRGLGDKPGEAEALRERAWLHWRAGAHAAALEDAREALALCRRIGDTGGEGSALHNLAEITRDAGSPLAALGLFEAAHDLHWSTGNRQGMVLARFGTGHAWQMLGDATQAERRFLQAHEIALQDGEQTMIARAEHALAMLYVDTGELERAHEHLLRVISRDRSINYAQALGHDLVDLARLHVMRDELIEARAALSEAAVWFDGVEDDASGALVAAMIAALHAGRPGDVVAATTRDFVRTAMPLAEGKVYCMFEARRAVHPP